MWCDVTWVMWHEWLFMNLRVWRVIISSHTQPSMAYKAFHNVLQHLVVLAHSFIPSTNICDMPAMCLLLCYSVGIRLAGDRHTCPPGAHKPCEAHLAGFNSYFLRWKKKWELEHLSGLSKIDTVGEGQANTEPSVSLEAEGSSGSLQDCGGHSAFRTEMP